MTVVLQFEFCPSKDRRFTRTEATRIGYQAYLDPHLVPPYSLCQKTVIIEFDMQTNVYEKLWKYPYDLSHSHATQRRVLVRRS